MNYSQSDLTGCSFKCSNLDDAVFYGASLNKAIFDKSDLKNASF
ncbi:hypothetical protein COC60_30025 [Bacillus thuringiensis]|uniref:Pentapeptide repeat-containing protein n=1 Tax=Bacillus thuringiensis TaxID=1428 RepID=A0ABD6SHK1_BACTU|nr:pentapeptide repeat-containing protein [Bacillus cereus]PDY96078.1 hypothetical protein CON12_32360 [Bacillus thuringiensis]PEU99301.1 hypothetical protein CN409_09100 [Bacillus sp. AFS012607]PEA94404.1 hypothetical protein CON66_19015 [Bacillus cereus]PEF28304.1 hypothetical protein CON39_22550 [Bacillus thuringiensis]